MVKITIQGPRKEERTLDIALGAPILFSGELRGEKQYLFGFLEGFQPGTNEKVSYTSSRAGTVWRKPKISVSSAYRLRKSRTLGGVEIPLIEWEGDRCRYSLNGTPEVYSSQEEITKILLGKEGFGIYAEFIRRIRLEDKRITF